MDRKCPAQASCFKSSVLIGDGHKEFAPDKVKDEDYYVLTLAVIAKELKAENEKSVLDDLEMFG